jgi:hypothetical protein
LANPNVQSAALQAGLSASQKAQVEGLSKLLDSHKNLLALPATQAQTVFSNLPQDQQNAHVAMFGGQDPATPSQRGWLGSAFHYLTEPVKQVVGRTFGALNEVSDFMTRLYRTGAIAADQGVDLAKAFQIANDKGDNVFSPDRIASAQSKYGKDITSVAMKVASGVALDQILAGGTDAEKAVASRAAQKKDPLFQDALDAVQAAKYSPGRQLANLVLPGFLEGSGALYKGISGVGDAAYRIFADPTLALGKAKKAYDAGDFMLFNVINKFGGNAPEAFTYGRNFMASVNNPDQLNRIFADPKVVNLFDQYGAELTKLEKARGARNFEEAAVATANLRRIAPEFGQGGIEEFIKAGVKDAETTKNFLANHADVKTILSGQAARKTPLVPRLDAARKARIAIFTGANKRFDIDKQGKAIVNAIYGSDEQDILQGLTAATERIAILEGSAGKLTKGKVKDGSFRLTPSQITGKIDRFARKFGTIPYFKNNVFDVMADDAADKIYQLASITNTRYHSRVIAAAFAAGEEGQRKQIFKGLWNTIAETRQVTKSQSGKDWVDTFSGKGLDYKYAADIVVPKLDELGNELLDASGNKVYETINPANFNGQQMALYGFQVSSMISVPSIVDLDRLSVRSGLINRMLGLSHKKWADDMTSGWVIGTLAGPKFPVRNAGEDLMMHLAVGDSPWGMAKGRLISTQWRKVKQAEMGLTKEHYDLGAKISDLVKKTDELTGPAREANLENIKTLRNQLSELDAKKISWYESQLGFMNRLIGRKDVKEFQVKLAEAGDDVEAVRKIMAEAIITNKFAGRALSDQQKVFIKEMAEHGRTQEVLANVSEGGKNALRGGDQFIQAVNDAKEFGTMRAIEYDGVKLKQSGEAFSNFNPVASERARLSWLVKIAVTTNDELSSIIVKDLNDPKKAVDNLVAYLDTLSPKDLKRFEIYSSSVGATKRQHAESLYKDVLNTFSKRDGTLNEDLWNAVRKVDDKGEVALSTKTLSVDDLPGLNDKDLHPEMILGPTLVPVSASDNIAATIIEKGWDGMGEANARFSREPIVWDAMLSIRQDMEDTGFAKRIMDQFTKGKTGDDLIKAERNAKEHITSIVEEMAKDRVLSFVDNPAVRSQLAMASRNFARFYRATEDFYRRIYRTVRYNPEALTRAALTYEGVAHSGFVQTDDNGEQYFFYPGLAPVYKVMNKMMRLFGVEDAFQVPMPVEFGGKLKMLTPSMNPDSMFPTFSGPLATVPLKMIGNVIPQVKDIEQYLSGSYGVDQPMIQALLPAHVNRLLAALDKSERSSQYASAARKAATYLEASGHGVQIKIDPATGQEIAPTPGEIAEYQDKLQASTLTVLGLRFAFGFFAPASPQVSLKSDMAQWVRDNERTSYKQVFNGLLEQYGSVDKATKEWIKLFPDQMPYTVSESESNTTAIVRAVDGANNWILANKDLLAKYPQGAAFLIPQAGDFDFNAYKLMFKEGLKQNKTLTDFVRQVSSAKDVQYYYTQKDAFDAQLQMTFSTDAKRQLRDQWETWSTQFKGARPLLQEQLGQGSEKAIERARAVDDLRQMLADPTVSTQMMTRKVLTQMLNKYDEYVSARDAISGTSGRQQDYKDMLKMNTKTAMQQLASQNANAQAAYDVLFARLMGD